MSVTYGFYNAQEHDRLYNAEQVSQLFDGLISNGVYQSIGNAMVVTASSGMTVTVGTGRAWFAHTWTLNDAAYPLTLDAAQSIVSRIDAIVLEIDARRSYRRNRFTIVKGTPTSGTPSKPTLTNTDDVHQYPLAWITIGKDVTAITQSVIENAVGTSSCPFVTGIVQQMSISALLAQWQAQWEEWLEDFQTEQTGDFESWRAIQEAAYESWVATQQQTYSDWITNHQNDFLEFEEEQQEQFDEWFANLHYVLDGDVAGHLQNEIEANAAEIDWLKENAGSIAIDTSDYVVIDYDKVRHLS